MRLYFKNRSSPKAYKVVITALNDSHLGFIGEITNPTMKIGNGVVQFYLAPLASKGTWNIEEDYHYANGKLTLLASKTLQHTSYNSHATHIDFTKNIQLALEQTEFHGFEIIRTAVRDLTSLSDADWMYDAENKKILYFNGTSSGSLTLLQVASKINEYTTSTTPLVKDNADLLIKELITDLFKTQPKGLLKPSEFNTSFIDNAVMTELGDEVYPDTSLNKYTSSSLNFAQGLVDRIPDVLWFTEGDSSIVVGGEAFSNNVLKTSKTAGSLITTSKLLKGGNTPFTVSFDFLIKEDQVKGTSTQFLPLFSKSTNGGAGDQFFYINYLKGSKLAFQRAQNVGGNLIQEVSGIQKIEFNTKYTVKLTYDGNMFKCFVNDVLDFKFGTSVGWFSDSNQPYRFLDNLVPSFSGDRLFTNGYIDNIQIDDGVSRDHTEVVDPYKNSLVSKLSFQGQANKTVFVDEAKSEFIWTGYGDAKLVVEDSLSEYSYLKLDGMSSYIVVENADHLMLNNSKFSIRIEFRTSTTSKRQILFDRFDTSTGAYQLSVNTDGKLYFTILPTSSYTFFESVASNLNDGNKHSVDIIKEGDSLLIYVDNILDSMHDVTGILFNYKALKTTIGAQVNFRNDLYDFNGNIYSLSIYDGVTVYPGVIVKDIDTVELDFNKNLIQDVKGNSTWTATDVTLDAAKAFKGYSASFSSNTSKLQTNSNVFNFGTGSFYTEANLKMDTPVVGEFRYYLTTADNPLDNGSVWYHASGSNLGIDYNPRPTSYGNMAYSFVAPNNYYNHKVIRQRDVIHNIINDVVCNTAIHNLDINLNKNNTTTLGMHPSFASSDRSSFKGSLDDFKVIKGYQEKVVMHRPTVHLPFENSSINTGYTLLETIVRGTPTHEEIEGKRCVKFSPSNYIQVTPNNVFNLGTNSKFYIEFDFYKTSGDFGTILSDNNGWTNGTSVISIEAERVYVYYRSNSVNITLTSSNKYEFNAWQNVKIYRDESGITTVELNGVKTTTTSTLDLNFARNSSYTSIGTYGNVTNENAFNGYLSNFKMFVGASEVPRSFDNKEVLSLDFKPTYKSYLFKDNFNKCVINPFNINHRSYEDGEYCVSFNGTDQYLSLGQNNLLNFDKDDFVFKIKFKVSDFVRTWQRLLSDNDYTSGAKNYIMITGDQYSTVDKRRKIFLGLDDTNLQYMYGASTLEPNVVYELKVVRHKNEISMYLNDVLESTFITTYPFNLNSNNNTFIGCGNKVDATPTAQSNQFFKGTIYSLEVYRNTFDVALLDDILPEPETPETTDDSGIPPLEKGILNFWQLRQEVDPRNVVLEFNQLRLE